MKKLSLVVVVLIGILLQGCGSINVKPDGGTAIIGIINYDIMSGVQHFQQDHFAYSDTSITSIDDVGDSTIITRCDYWTDAIQWRTAFLRKDEESRIFAWYTGSAVNILTRDNAEARDWDHPDTICVIGRRFDNKTGQLLDQRELTRLIDDDEKKHYGFKVSADSSYMLMSIANDYEEAGEDEEVWNAELFVISADMAKIQKAKVGIVVPEDYADDYNPGMAVSNDGHVFYTCSRMQSDTVVQQSVVRLDMARNRSDTLTVRFPMTLSPEEWVTYTLEPHEPNVQALGGDTVLLAWPYFDGKYLMSVAVSKFDFRSTSVVFNDTLLFDDETCDYLIDDHMGNFQLSCCITLPSGETLLALECSNNYVTSHQPMMPPPPPPSIRMPPSFRMVTVPSAPVVSPVLSAPVAAPVPVAPPPPREIQSENGSIVVVKLAASGEVQWKSSIILDETTVVYGHHSSYRVTDSSLCILYRDGDTDDGVILGEFMLSDGRSRRWELPVAFTGKSDWYSNYSLWLRDAIVLYGAVGSRYLCIRLTPSGKYTWFDKESARRIVGGKRIDE